MAKTRIANRTLAVFIPSHDCVGGTVGENKKILYNDFYKTHIPVIKNYFEKSIYNYLKSKGMKNPKIKICDYKYPAEAKNRFIQYGYLSDNSEGYDCNFLILDEVVFLSDFKAVIEETKKIIDGKIQIVSNPSLYLWVLLHKCSAVGEGSEKYIDWLKLNGVTSSIDVGEIIEITDENLSNAKLHADKFSLQNDKVPYTNAHIEIIGMLDKFLSV